MTTPEDGLWGALRDAEASVARLRSIVDCVGDAVFTTDVDGVVTSWNTGAVALLGHLPADILGSDVGVLHPPGSDDPRRIRELLEAGGWVRGLEIMLRTRDGRFVEVSVDVTALHDDAGAPTGAVVVGRDIGDRRELEAELVRQTMYDVLTGLPNRAYLSYRLTQALAAARREGRPVAVLVVDLDRFKAVDDVHGHLVGDRVLAEIADRLRSVARPTDLVARLGGDEFVLVCPDTDVAGAGEVTDRLLQAVAAPIDVGHRALRIGASVGIAVSPPLDDDAAALLEHADVAVCEAKARGRSQSLVFDHEFSRQAADRRRLAADLYAALSHDDLEVHYQPVLDLTAEQLVGLEALVRWQHPLRGSVAPATFVPLAEEHGFVAELDQWVLERACRDTVEAFGSGRIAPNVRVAVNLSARSLDDRDLASTIGDVLDRSGLPAGSLVLEVTETALLQSRDTARASLEALRALGAGVFLDDFGTGYSSLSFLRELPVTGVKIDRSFVHDVVNRTEDIAITEAVVRLAHGLGLETVAEGVETVEQRDLLRRLGCATGQGYLWSAAAPMADLAAGSYPGPDGLDRLHETSPALLVQPRRWSPLPRRRSGPDPAGPRRTACCLRGGLEAGQAWLVIISAVRRESFARSLGPVRSAAVASGQLVELDAYDTLRKVTGADGRLDTTRFEHVLGSALQRLGSVSSEIGVHAELGQVNQPVLSLRVSADLQQRLHAMSRLDLESRDQPADCAAHGPLPVAGADGSAAS